eukprot:361505-Chlamydomonas_euryale.AAC.2
MQGAATLATAATAAAAAAGASAPFPFSPHARPSCAELQVRVPSSDHHDPLEVSPSMQPPAAGSHHSPARRAARGGGRHPAAGANRGGGAGGGGSGTHVVAALKKFDSCGEALILGSGVASHADVVVGSSGAVLLSLTYADFEAALKGVLGLVR